MTIGRAMYDQALGVTVKVVDKKTPAPWNFPRWSRRSNSAVVATLTEPDGGRNRSEVWQWYRGGAPDDSGNCRHSVWWDLLATVAWIERPLTICSDHKCPSK